MHLVRLLIPGREECVETHNYRFMSILCLQMNALSLRIIIWIHKVFNYN